jgi:hypothetical protein
LFCFLARIAKIHLFTMNPIYSKTSLPAAFMITNFIIYRLPDCHLFSFYISLFSLCPPKTLVFSPSLTISNFSASRLKENHVILLSVFDLLHLASYPPVLLMWYQMSITNSLVGLSKIPLFTHQTFFIHLSINGKLCSCIAYHK